MNIILNLIFILNEIFSVHANFMCDHASKSRFRQNYVEIACDMFNSVLKSRFGSLCFHLKPKENNFAQALMSWVSDILFSNVKQQITR